MPAVVRHEKAIRINTRWVVYFSCLMMGGWKASTDDVGETTEGYSSLILFINFAFSVAKICIR